MTLPKPYPPTEIAYTDWNTLVDAVQPLVSYPESEASYIIFTDGVNYYAKNGTTGHIDYSGTVAHTIINNAITTLNGLNGGTVYLKGSYTLTGTINILSNVNLIGEGRGATVLIQTGVNLNGITFSGSTEFCKISDLKIQMDAGTRNGIYSTGVDIRDCVINNLQITVEEAIYSGVRLGEFYRTEISNLYIISKGHGVYAINDDVTSNIGDSVWSNIQITLSGATGARYGFYLSGRQSAALAALNDVYIINPTVSTGIAHNNQLTGVFLAGASRINLIHPNIQNLDTGINIAGVVTSSGPCNGVTIQDGYILNTNLGTEIIITTSAYNTQIVGGSLDKKGITDNTYESSLGRVTKYQDDQLTRNTSILSPYTVKEVYDDFLGAIINPMWNATYVGSGATTMNPAYIGGYITLTTDIHTSDSVTIDFANYGFCTRRGGFFFQTMCAKLSTNPFDLRWGLYNGTIGALGHGVYFECLSTDTNYFAVTNNGAAQTRIDTGISRTGNFKNYGISTDEGTTHIYFYINGQQVADATNTLPGSAVGLQPFFNIVTQADAAKELSIDYIKVISSRYS